MLSVCVSIPFLGSPRSVMTRTFTTCPTVEKTWRNLSSVVELLTFPMKICHFESFDMVLAWLAAAAAAGRVWCGAWVQVGWGKTGEARVGLGWVFPVLCVVCGASCGFNGVEKTTGTVLGMCSQNVGVCLLGGGGVKETQGKTKRSKPATAAVIIACSRHHHIFTPTNPTTPTQPHPQTAQSLVSLLTFTPKLLGAGRAHFLVR